MQRTGQCGLKINAENLRVGNRVYIRHTTEREFRETVIGDSTDRSIYTFIWRRAPEEIGAVDVYRDNGFQALRNESHLFVEYETSRGWLYSVPGNEEAIRKRYGHRNDAERAISRALSRFRRYDELLRCNGM